MSDKKDSPSAPAAAPPPGKAAPEKKATVTPPAPPAPPPRPSGKPPAPPPGRRGATAVLALLLALLALIAVAIAGWQIWRMQRTRHASAHEVRALSQRVTGMQRTLQNGVRQRQALSDALDKVNGANQDLRQQVAGLSQRADHLEGAVASLSRRAVSGHEQLLLNQTELLLRMGEARYRLFHEARGAAQAYAQAEKTLEGLDDPSYGGVRQSIDNERQALLAAQPQQRDAQLAQLGTWRTQAIHWPLQSQHAAKTSHATGFWARVWHAVSRVVRVHHDRGAPFAAADAHLARELTALDLAQAQAALLADDQSAFRQALKRADTALGRNFDTRDAAVQAARARLAKWIKSKPSAAPELGAALQKLSNLRSVNGTDDSGPATSSSTGGGSP